MTNDIRKLVETLAKIDEAPDTSNYLWVFPKRKLNDLEDANIFYGTPKDYVKWISRGPAYGLSIEQILAKSAKFAQLK